MGKTPPHQATARESHSFLPLEGAEAETLRLVFNVTTNEQWVEWLRVPLEHAAATGNHDLFTKLMKAGAKCDAGWEGCYGRTLLHAAAQGGDSDVLATVLRGGCRSDIIVPSGYGRIPMIISPPSAAIQAPHEAAVLQGGWGSDISVLSDYGGIPRRSPLYAAIEAGHEAAARQLVLAGADVNYSDPEDGCVPLVKAIEGGQGDLTRDLLIAGASLDDWKDPEHGRSRLHVAAEKGYDKVVSALVCTNLDVDAVDNESKTPLMLASQNGHVATAKALLIAGADVGLLDEEDRSSLHFAVEKGHTNVLKTVIKFGTSVPHSSRDDESGYEDEEGIWEDALYSAVCCDQVDSVETLLNAGVNINFLFYKDEHEECTPLLIAVATNSTKAMLVLLQRGALVHLVDQCSNSGLHLACKSQKKGFDITVDLLLRRGVSEAARNDGSETAADVLEASVGEGQCSEAELERVRLLLKRAPQDRAWRRRCFLIMLRSRIDKTRQLDSKADADKEDEGSDKQRSLFDAEGSKSSGNTIVSPNHDARGSGRSNESNEIHPDEASVTTGASNSVEGVGRGGWSGCVAFVVDQAPDPVFRAVVLFL